MMLKSEDEARIIDKFFEEKFFPITYFNIPKEDGLCYLHDAAQYFNDDLAYFLLRHGARIDVRCNCVGHKFHGFLPVDVALESLSQIVDWTPKESIFKLIVMFCMKKMVQPLMTIKILVAHMEPKQIRDVICHYAERGNLIEFAALLTSVAQARLRAFYPFTCDFEVESCGRMETLSISLATKIVSLIDEEQKAMIRKKIKLANTCKEKQRLILYRIMLLEIYERIGDVIGECLNAAHTSDLAQDMGAKIAYNIKKEGFPLTDEHLQVFKRLKWRIELDEAEDKFGDAEQCGYNLQKRDPAFPLFLQLDNPLTTKKKSTRRPLKQQLRSISTHSWHGKTGLFSMVQSFHLQRFKTSASLEVCTNMEAQTKNTFQVIKRQVLDLLLNKGVSTFSLVIRRAIGRA